MNGYRFAVILTKLTVLFAAIALSGLVWTGYSTKDWDFPLIGVYLALFAIGLGSYYQTTSSRTGTERFNELVEKINTLSDKIDEMARRQDELIALVEGSPDHASTADPGPESPTNCESAHHPPSH